MVIILDIEQKRREREKEIRASFLFWPQLCFFSLDDVYTYIYIYICACVCMWCYIHSLIVRKHTYTSELLREKEWKRKRRLLALFLPSLRMYIFEQLQGHFDVNNERRVKMNGQRKTERRREEEKKEKVIRTSKEPLHIHIDRAHCSDYC